MKKLHLIKSLSLIMVSIPVGLIAQSGEAGHSNSFENILATSLIAVTAVVFIGALIAVYRLFNMIIQMREKEIYEDQGLTEYMAEKKAAEGPSLKKLYQKLSGMVPMAKEKDILFDHDYDGIKELDNNLPPWWLYGFYLTIAIAIFYMAFYHFSPYAKSSSEIFENEMTVAQAAIDDYLAGQADQVDENTVTLLSDDASLAQGATTFNTLCAVCHLKHGGGSPGSVGPNLTDKYWLHGGSIVDIFKTIKYGVPEKGMISWKSQLRPADIHKVSSYILSLQGTNPPNAKDPQGELYEPDE